MRTLYLIFCILSSVPSFAYLQKTEHLLLQEKKYSLTDFGAKGDGISDDTAAFLKALLFVQNTPSKILFIPGNYTFNLEKKTIDFRNFKSGIILAFEGGVILNGNLLGHQTRIKADRINIFENINLSGSFISTTDYAYPEWYGAFPFDINVDLVDALIKLDPVFYDISLGAGDYYTKKGQYMVKGLKGLSMAKTRVIMENDRSNTYVFSLGKVGGSSKERNYEYNYIKDLTVAMSSVKNTRLTGNRGIIIGAAHKPMLENVKVFIFGDKLQFSETDLEEFVTDRKKMEEANVGLEFNGDSEVTNISNFFTLSDIGVLFTTFCDFVTIRDYMSWTGPYGLSNVYYKSKALNSQNILFTGAQSWNQGLFGLYTENSITYNSFPNVKFENLRIEQLVSTIKKQNKLKGANIWIGENETISNLQFENIMFAGNSNGIHIGNTTYGRVSMENIITWGDPKVKKDFALDINYKISDAPLLVYLKNISLPSDTESYFKNANVIYNGYVQESVHEGKNLFKDNIIVGKSISVKKINPQGTQSTSYQQIIIPNNNKNFIKLVNSTLSEIQVGKTTMKYSIEIIAGDIYETFEFIIFNSGKISIIKDSKSITFSKENKLEENKLNIIQDKDSGVIFLFNRLGNETMVNVTANKID